MDEKVNPCQNSPIVELWKNLNLILPVDKSRYVPLSSMIFLKILKSLAQENDKSFSKTNCAVTLCALCYSGQLLFHALNTLFPRICSSPYPTCHLHGFHRSHHAATMGSHLPDTVDFWKDWHLIQGGKFPLLTYMSKGEKIILNI